MLIATGQAVTWTYGLSPTIVRNYRLVISEIEQLFSWDACLYDGCEIQTCFCVPNGSQLIPPYPGSMIMAYPDWESLRYACFAYVECSSWLISFCSVVLSVYTITLVRHAIYKFLLCM